MSAFVVQNDVINAVVTYLASVHASGAKRLILAETGKDLSTRQGRIALGTAMHELNCKSVDVRYGAGDSAGKGYEYRAKVVDAVQAYKWLRCWIYQCTEGDIEQDPLYITMEKVSDAMAHHIVSSLPRYEQAEW